MKIHPTHARHSSKSSLLFFGIVCSSFLSVFPLTAKAEVVLESLDFETALDFTNNFRFTSNPVASTQTQTSNGAANDYVATLSAAGSVNARTAIFDKGVQGIANQNLFAPTVPTLGIKVTADIRAASAGSSFGVFIVNPVEGTANTHPLALFSWDTSGLNDRLRLFSVAQISGNGVGTAVLDNGLSNSGLAVGDTAFAPMSLIYKQSISDPTAAIFNFTVGSITTGDISLGANTYLPSFEIGFRTTDGNSVSISPSVTNTTDFDNLQIIDLVPEPSTYALCAIGFGIVLFIRRKSKILPAA
jgi:hypothetical protein